jgi:hypothetical protein
MPPRQKTPDDALKRLAQYWSRAALMRDLMHVLIDKHGGIQKVIDADADWELEAYLSYWLAGLFVVVEGFNKLRLRDARVQKAVQRTFERPKAIATRDVSLHHFSREGR